MDHPGSRKRPFLRAIVGVLMVLGAVPLALFVYLVVAHFGGRWNFERHARQWADVVAREAPVGTAQGEVERLFASRGVVLTCHTRGNVATCSAREDEHFGLLPEWFLHFEATFEDGRLVRIVQTRLGVGL